MAKIGRPSAQKLMKEVISFCRENNITAAEVTHETGYTNSDRLLRGKLCTISNDAEILLRMWLADQRAKPRPVKEIQMDLKFDEDSSIFLSVPIARNVDLELDLMQALAFVVDHYRTKLTPAQLNRAVAWAQERC